MRATMPMIKKVAVAHRHNFIVTEHIVLGLIAEPTSATASLSGQGDRRRHGQGSWRLRHPLPRT